MDRRLASLPACAADRRAAKAITRDFQDADAAAGALPGGGLRLSGRGVAAFGKAARRAERASAADRLRGVPAEPRPDRQPRLRRAADAAGRPAGAAGGDGAAAARAQDPDAVHGRGMGGRAPFLFFTDHNEELAEARARGPARGVPAFRRLRRTRRSARASPIRTTRRRSQRRCPIPDEADSALHEYYTHAAAAAASRIVVPGIPGCRSAGAEVLGEGAVLARWTLGNGGALRLAINLGAQDGAACRRSTGALLFESRERRTLASGTLPAAQHGRVRWSANERRGLDRAGEASRARARWRDAFGEEHDVEPEHAARGAARARAARR